MTRLRRLLPACFAAFVIAVSPLAAGDTPAAEATEPATQVAESTAPAAKEDRMVCKRTAATGTRIARKTCRRQSEIDRMERDAREATDTFQRRAAGQSTTDRGD